MKKDYLSNKRLIESDDEINREKGDQFSDEDKKDDSTPSDEDEEEGEDDDLGNDFIEDEGVLSSDNEK